MNHPSVPTGLPKKPRNGKRATANGHDDRLVTLLEALLAADRGDFKVRLDLTPDEGVMNQIAAALTASSRETSSSPARWCASSASSDAKAA